MSDRYAKYSLFIEKGYFGAPSHENIGDYEVLNSAYTTDIEESLTDFIPRMMKAHWSRKFSNEGYSEDFAAKTENEVKSTLQFFGSPALQVKMNKLQPRGWKCELFIDGESAWAFENSSGDPVLASNVAEQVFNMLQVKIRRNVNRKNCAGC